MCAFDLETTGLDPRVDRITTATLYGAGLAMCLEAEELAIIDLLAASLARVEGTVIGWNSSVFDFPFLHARCVRAGRTPFFTMTLNPDIVPKYDPLPGYEGGYDILIDGAEQPLAHHDIAYDFEQWAKDHGVAWSLKPVARAHGIEMIEVDREHMERLSVPERLTYNLSDSVGTLRLGEILAERAA